jgi:Zn-dependent peptidase ImmA (M78 family)/DNA-binding XRE family transcriptional regulator
MVNVPVADGVLIWAREYRGLSQEEAAEKLDLALQELQALEAGETQPTLTLFERIATRYQLPQATLFRRTPPKTPPRPRDFRTLAGRGPQWSFDLLLAISQARGLQTRLQEVEDEDEELAEPVRLPHYSEERDPWQQGEAERRRLGVSVEEQMRWHRSEVFREWRSVIEGAGVSSYLLKFSLESGRGFSLHDPGERPAIVANKAEQFEPARAFTLIHEYAHILVGQPGVSDQSWNNATEAFCNRFAAGFLMPVEALRAVLPYWPNEPVNWSNEQIVEFARALNVSRSALALRLQELGMAPDNFFDRFQDAGGNEVRPGGGGGNYVNTRLSEIGERFPRTMLAAVDHGSLDYVRAAEHMAIAPRHFETLHNRLARRQVVGGRG